MSNVDDLERELEHAERAGNERLAGMLRELRDAARAPDPPKTMSYEGDQAKPRITLTGIDSKVLRWQAQQLLDEHPSVELGILWSDTRDAPRYMRRSAICSALEALASLAQPGRGNMRLAVHVCGAEATRAFLGLAEDTRLDVSDMMMRETIRAYAARVQINGRPSRWHVARATGIFRRSIITQWRPMDRSAPFTVFPNTAVLVDASGGRGVEPETWSVPDVRAPVGFAGGLSLENLAFHLPKILPLARPGFWIDMETSLRTNDWFDMERAKATVQVFETLIARAGL